MTHPCVHAGVPVLDRRTFLRGTAAVGGALVVGAAPAGVWAQPAHADESAVRVYLLVVDGLRPDQVARMPQVAELAEEGTSYTAGRAGMVAETGPNHTSMITGMRAARNGHPGNAVPGLPERVGEDPRYLKADTLFTLAQRQAPDYVVASVNAKTYVVNTARHDRTGDGDEDADSVYDPPVTAPDDSTRDQFTGTEGVRISRELDPDFFFWNLGDVDRAGHIDQTGGLFEGVDVDGTEPAFQAAAIANADALIRSMVEELKDSGRWENTVFIVTADHNMDWSFPDRFVDLAGPFDDDELLRDEIVTAINGGACLYGLRSPDDPQANERLRRMRQIALATDGIRDALYIRPNPADGGEEHWVGRVHPEWGLLGDYTGELIVTVEQGWRIGHEGPDSNPIPGNHGHPSTLPIPVIIAGGWEGIRQQRIDAHGEPADTDEPDDQARNIDLAPTAAWLLGLHPPPGGYDGRVLAEAFDRRPRPRVDVANVQSMPVIDHIVGDDVFATSVALSHEALPEGFTSDQPEPGDLPIVTGDEFGPAEMITAEFRDETAVVVVPDDGGLLGAIATPLAAALRAPVLLARADGLPGVVAAEVERLAPDRAVLVGSTDQLGDQVEDDLADAGVDEVVRLGGDDDADTARLVAAEVGFAGASGTAGHIPMPSDDGEDDDDDDDANRQVLLVARDAGQEAVGLTTGAVGILRRRPVLLTDADSVPEATEQAISELGVDRVIIVGDDAAVSETVAEGLRDGGALVERIGAGGALETARLLTERTVREGAPTDDVYVAFGEDAAAALATAAAVGILRGVVVPALSSGLGNSGTRRFLTERADEFVRLRFVGALPAELSEEVERVVEDERTREFPVDDPDVGDPDDPDDDPADPDEPDAAPAPDTEPPTPRPSRELPRTGSGVMAGGLAALGLGALLRVRRRQVET